MSVRKIFGKVFNEKSQYDSVVVLGLQWGDEGKGKIVDMLTAMGATAVIRFQGGNNAGHTLMDEGKSVVLHLVPCGILTEGVECMIGTGVVVSMKALVHEIEKLKDLGVDDIEERLLVSDSCTMILPSHIALDKAREIKVKRNAIGTTGRGIGPTYEDRAARRALLFRDMKDRDEFRDKVVKLTEYHNFFLEKYFNADIVDADEAADECLMYRDKIWPFVGDVPGKLIEIRKNGGKLIFEGSQGFLLDINHGTYPFVTSSSVTAGNAASGSGCGPKHLNKILGVIKAYTTRVGSGEFLTELDKDDENGQYISTVGKEVGATTGRDRRCGWLDLVSVKRSVELNSVTEIALNKIDVLDGIKEIYVCKEYKTNKDGSIEPIYTQVEKWDTPTFGVTDFKKLPRNAQKYIKMVQDFIGVPVHIVSTGPDRKHTIVLKKLL